MIWDVAGLLLRSSILLSVAAGMRMLPRNRSAVVRHRITVTAFSLLLLWPLFPLLLPFVYLPFLQQSSLQGLVSVESTSRIRGVEKAFPLLPTALALIWATGFSCVLLRVLLAHWRALRLKRQGQRVSGGSMLDFARAVSAEAGLRSMPQVVLVPDRAMPQTSGVWKPSIVLPKDFMAWPLQRRRAVLLHELAHVRRHDTRWWLLANLTLAFWWFQPLGWIARRWVREDSEQASDAFVLQAGIPASVYGAELLAIARSSQVWPTAALPMAEATSLGLRLEAILQPATKTDLRRGSAFAMIALAFASICCSSLSFARGDHWLSKGGVSMRRTLFSTMFTGLLASAGLSAAAIGGSVLDPTGAAVPDAKASIYNPDSQARQETVSTADGKFGFEHLQAGQYILKVEKPGFSPVLRAFNIQQDSTVSRGLTLRSNDGPGAAQTNMDVTTVDGAKPIRVGGQVAQNNLVTKVQPVYPPAAKTAHVQGAVELETIISEEGVPQDIRVVSSPSDDLSQSALEAVRQWRYQPTLLNGNPVAIVTQVVVNYTLLP